MRTESAIQIIDGPTFRPVDAVLIDGVTRDELIGSDLTWQPFLLESLREQVIRGRPISSFPEHYHWSWRQKENLAQRSRFVGVSCGGEMQGLMLVRTSNQLCRLPSQRGLPMVYIDYISTAPWNLLGLVEIPRYRAVGTVLMVSAIDISQNVGFEGRIGLHSLPQAEGFYIDKCGMIGLGPDPAYEGLLYCEMTSEQADRLAQEIRQ